MSLRLRNPLGALAWATALLPGRLFGGAADWALGAAAALVAVAVLGSKPAPWETRRPARRAAQFFAGLLLLTVLSYAYSAAFNGLQTGPLDWLELARPVLLGAFAVHLIRHHDERVALDLDAALAVSLYAVPFYAPGPEYAWTAALTMCWMLFFSRGRLRLVHAGSALILILLLGGRTAWAAGLWIAAAAIAARLYEDLVKGRTRWAVQLTVLSFALLAAAPVVAVRAALSPSAVGAAREESSADALRAIRRSPLLGWGPARYEAASAVPDQYLYWTLRGGLVGLAWVLAGALAAAWGLYRRMTGDMTGLLGVSALLGATALLLLSGQFLGSFRLCLLTGLVAASASGRQS